MSLFRLYIIIIILLIFPTDTIHSSITSPKRETRAVWIATIKGLDWPTSYANSPDGIERQKNELRCLLDSLQKIHINTILLQTRIRGTVIYPSEFEPWDECFTGIPGKAPGYDPLDFAVTECHKRGMELHAWIVAFPLKDTKTMQKLGKNGLLHTHPELCKRTSTGWIMDPGVPGTAPYLAKMCEEVVRNYDIDGIHLDYIRYPEKELKFDDRQTYRKYGHKKPLSQWRRDNVTTCMETIRRSIKAQKPWIKISCAPIGKASDLSRYSSYGWNAYHTVHQDAQGWLKQDLVDILFPMMYFKDHHFYPFALDWAEQSDGKPVIPGLGVYQIDQCERNWPLQTLTQEIDFLRNIHSGGQAYYRCRFLTKDTKGIYRFLQSFYTHPALTPVLPRETSRTVPCPTDLSLECSADRLRLKWKAPATRPDVRYNIYVSDSYPVDTDNPKNLKAAALWDEQHSFPLPYALATNRYYAMTASDRYGNESEAIAFNHPRAKQQPHDSQCLPCADNRIILPHTDGQRIYVTDAVGRTTEFTYRDTLDVSALRPGFYRLKIEKAEQARIPLGYFLK